MAWGGLRDLFRITQLLKHRLSNSEFQSLGFLRITGKSSPCHFGLLNVSFLGHGIKIGYGCNCFVLQGIQHLRTSWAFFFFF